MKLTWFNKKNCKAFFEIILLDQSKHFLYKTNPNFNKESRGKIKFVDFGMKSIKNK